MIVPPLLIHLISSTHIFNDLIHASGSPLEAGHESVQRRAFRVTVLFHPAPSPGLVLLCPAVRLECYS